MTWKRLPTEAEVDAFCEATGSDRPDPRDMRAVNSFASWFFAWRDNPDDPEAWWNRDACSCRRGNTDFSVAVSMVQDCPRHKGDAL